jgi:hypothetical protein
MEATTLTAKEKVKYLRQIRVLTMRESKRKKPKKWIRPIMPMDRYPVDQRERRRSMPVNAEIKRAPKKTKRLREIRFSRGRYRGEVSASGNHNAKRISTSAWKRNTLGTIRG